MSAATANGTGGRELVLQRNRAEEQAVHEG